ncbi:MAG: sugar ABC transporter permease [Clostridia bacterium]|nr:sugar ABC transporter permease [Clostridia bacterium]
MEKIRQVSKRRENVKNWVVFLSFVLLPLIQFAVFYVAVNINSILLSFKTYGLNNQVRWGFDNFSLIFTPMVEGGNLEKVLNSLRNSGVAFAVRTIIGMSFGLLFSYYVFKKMPGHNFFKVMLFLPTIVSSVVMVIVFRLVAEEAIPFIITNDRFAPGITSNQDTRFLAVLIYNIWAGFGTQVLMYLGAMNNVSDGALEAAKIDGANAVQEFTKVVFPGIYPTFMVFLTVNIVEFFTHQMALHTFYGFKELKDSKSYTLGYYMYREVALANGNFAQLTFPAALGIVCTLIAVPITFGVRKLLFAVGPKEE